MRQAGQIVLFKFPQTNLDYSKPRPALLLGRLPGQYDDWLISMISSKTHQYIEGMDEIITVSSQDFKDSGLRTESLIRVARLAVVDGDILLGTIGEISSERLARIRNNLAAWIRTGN
jgi:mRNA interferase MazF